MQTPAMRATESGPRPDKAGRRDVRLHSLPVFLLLCLCVMLAAVSECGRDAPQPWQGYVEGEFVYVAAPKSGHLTARPVFRGQEIQAGTRVFSLDHDFEQAAADAAREELARAESSLADMRKGVRPSERETILAQLDRATTEAGLARIEYERRARLLEEGSIAQEELDRVKTDFATATQAIRQIEAELRTSSLGSRADALLAAEAEVRAARARLDQALWELEQRSQDTAVSGLVFDTFFNPGDWVPAGRPVLSVLPPDLRKVRFFVPEPLLGAIRAGQNVRVSWDGLAEPVVCTVSHVSSQAEYTPPVIYSSQSRAKLVFMAEAVPAMPEKALLLHPGQPVDVWPDAPGIQ